MQQIPRYRHRLLSSRDFVRELTQANMSETEFSKLTGVRQRTLEKWMRDEDPPFWVALFFKFMASEKARRFAHVVAERHLIDEADYRHQQQENAQ